MTQADAIRRIVIFADGTGNAFSTQESNVWRLFNALDLTAPDQVAHYIEGVGTSGFKPFAAFDGATGVGVPANVRRLYRFLCWNWRPGVDIYLFGFSRGAFTIRTLMGLVASEGLIPVAFDDGPVSRAEMKRNAMAAWRAYRAKAIRAGDVLPTILVTRALRDVILKLYHGLIRHRSYAAVRAAMDGPRRAPPMRFAGLFDTVEAYGVPVNEMRAAIDWAIWPMSFRNRTLAPTVDFARHALSLDDERATFHPVRFDMAREPAAAGRPRIKEVWFAGVHSDVGGGYPDGALSLVPLVWIADEAIAAAGQGGALRFVAGAVETFRAEASPLGPRHDSRRGLATLYRYDPRKIEAGAAAGGPPNIHHAVAEKMVFGTENYAPLTLPSTANVLMPDGRLHAIAGFQARRRPRLPSGAPALAPDPASLAVERLNAPNRAFVDLTRDMIWWRRLLYFVLLLFVLIALALPKTAPWLDRGITALLEFCGHTMGIGSLAIQAGQRLDDARGGLGSNLNDLSATFGGFVPSYAQGWVKALVAQPLASFIILALTLMLYGASASLRDRIADHARCAWFFNNVRRGAPDPRVPLAARFARAMRTSRLVRLLRRFVLHGLVPFATLAFVLVAAMLLVGRTVVSYRAGSGALCQVTKGTLRYPKEAVANLAEGFSIDKPCWGSGIVLDKGRTYRVWIEMDEPWVDRDRAADVAGFSTQSPGYLLGLPFRRWWTADWFQPIARIGSSGNVEWPLQSAEGVTPREIGKEAHVEGDGQGLCAKPKVDQAEVRRVQKAIGVRTSFVSQFTAQGSGELFLFVNDTIAAVPFGPLIDCLYRNNSGTAKVTVELVASPKPPAPDLYDFTVAR